MRRALLCLSLALAACSGGSKKVTVPPPVGADVTLESLKQDVPTHGFRPVALYLDAADKPMGARFVHAQTGFTFDYLRIESAPQGYLWVNSFPTSDKGEPHTQEHLLLGKGNRGRTFNALEAMSLAESSAFTEQWRTSYHFHTVAGHDVFWSIFENQLDAMLNPDYSDEEIRREVRNFGVDRNDDGTLRLEEKGTVYNEMQRYYEQPETVAWRLAGQLVYGVHHPLSYDSGGHPDAIRTMTPEDIRGFHHDAYHLANMGIIGAFPSSMRLVDVLDHTGAILDKLAGRKGTVTTEADLPPPAGAKAGVIETVEYPYADESNPSPMMLAWPAVRKLDVTEHTLLSLFLSALAGDESTTLYKQLIDQKTRVLETGATEVSSYLSIDLGEPVFVTLTGVTRDHLDAATAEKVRALVADDLARIAKLPKGAPELVAFNARVASRLVARRRELAKFLDTPPGFGLRLRDREKWQWHLHMLQRAEGWTKSVTMKPQLDAIEQLLASGDNIWSERIAAWSLNETPYVVIAKPAPALRATVDAERKARIDAELARLQAQYGTQDVQTTLQKFAADYDKGTAEIEAAAAGLTMPKLVDSVPMTFDDAIVAKTADVRGVPVLRATFETMQSSRVGLAFRLDVVPEADLFYLALLPQLLREVGVLENGAPVPSDEVNERLRNEILALDVSFDHNARTGRAELVIEGAGNDVEETRKALAWMTTILSGADWRKENLPRIRDLLAQSLDGFRRTMLDREEDWVSDPRDAWWRQTWPVFAHTHSFLTQAHDVHRLRWMLQDSGDAKVTGEAAKALETLAGASEKLDRKQLSSLTSLLAGGKGGEAAARKWAAPVEKLPAAARAILKDAGKDLGLLLADLPDDSLRADWAYLCKQMAKDLRAGSAAALAKLDEVRRAVLTTGNARGYAVGSTSSLDAIAPQLDAVVRGLDTAAPQRQTYSATRLFEARLRGRKRDAKAPVFVGLVNPSTSSGVFLNSAPSATYTETDEPALLDYLAGNLYSGHGPHGLFMKTWAAGLAYSNGIRPAPGAGRLTYYAERCPLLPQTMRFVISVIKEAKPDPAIAEYALAQAFSSRIASSYETRTRGLAADLVDGVGPDVIRTFRGKLQELRKRPDLTKELFARMPAVYAEVLPGLGASPANVPDIVQFVIGPEPQLNAYADYLKSSVDKDAVLWRLYPRDFWVPASL
jgi:Zn-dependent M16 (insulinase) family peptidase